MQNFRKSASIKELATALAKAQAEFTAVPFNSVNPFLRNKYADLGSVIESAKPILAKYGLSVSQLVLSDEHSIGVNTVLMHNSGEWLESVAVLPIVDEKGKSDAQVAGSIVTYLRRYAYASVLGLYAEEDSDGKQPQKPETRHAAKSNVASPQQLVEKATALKAEKEEPIALIAQLKVTAKAQFYTSIGKHPSEEQAKKLAAVIGHALGDKYKAEEKESLRHQLYKRIAGVEHGKEMDLALAATMQTRWCQPSNHYEANDVAKNEIAQLLVAIQKENGQTTFA